MQVDLYQTLKSINVADDQAKLVVASLQDHIDNVVRDATKPLSEKSSTGCIARLKHT